MARPGSRVTIDNPTGKTKSYKKKSKKVKGSAGGHDRAPGRTGSVNKDRKRKITVEKLDSTPTPARKPRKKATASATPTPPRKPAKSMKKPEKKKTYNTPAKRGEMTQEEFRKLRKMQGSNRRQKQTAYHLKGRKKG
jgi:hypothetical protein